MDLIYMIYMRCTYHVKNWATASVQGLLSDDHRAGFQPDAATRSDPSRRDHGCFSTVCPRSFDQFYIVSYNMYKMD